LIVGIAAAYWRNRYLQRQRRRIPSVWPLKVRPMVNSRERKVWLWLTKVMFDQQVLVKLPVTRFTVPSQQTEATHWYKLLNGVYCTFTVCGLDGKVIGCVDVPGSGGLSLGKPDPQAHLAGAMQCALLGGGSGQPPPPDPNRPPGVSG